MPIFKNDKDSLGEVEKLKEELQKSQNDLSRVKIHLVKSKTDIVSLTRELDQANEELRVSKKALRKDGERGGAPGGSFMFQIPGQLCWVDLSAVWHVGIEKLPDSENAESEGGRQALYALFINKQLLMHGDQRFLQETAEQIIKTKERLK